MICQSSYHVQEGRIPLNQVARNNLRVEIGDSVEVIPQQDIRYGNWISIRPLDDHMESLNMTPQHVFDVYLKPFFAESAYISLNILLELILLCPL